MITGAEIAVTRTDLGFNRAQFADLVGVHVGTLYRWEAAGPAGTRLDPLQQRLLIALRAELDQHPSAEARIAWGASLATALVVRGSLFALYKLLEAVFARRR